MIPIEIGHNADVWEGTTQQIQKKANFYFRSYFYSKIILHARIAFIRNGWHEGARNHSELAFWIRSFGS